MLQSGYELLAQLEEKYGEDVAPQDVVASAHGARSWQSTGDVSVHVLEADALLVSRRARVLTMQSVRTSVKASLHGARAKTATRATAWCVGAAPIWNEKLTFERCSRNDLLLLQVRPGACLVATSALCCGVAILRCRLMIQHYDTLCTGA